MRLIRIVVAATTLWFGATAPSSAQGGASDPLDPLGFTQAGSASATQPTGSATARSPYQLVEQLQRANNTLTNVKKAADDYAAKYTLGPLKESFDNLYNSGKKYKKAKEDAENALLDDWGRVIDGQQPRNDDRIRRDEEQMDQGANEFKKAVGDVPGNVAGTLVEMPIQLGLKQLKNASDLGAQIANSIEQGWKAGGYIKKGYDVGKSAVDGYKRAEQVLKSFGCTPVYDFKIRNGAMEAWLVGCQTASGIIEFAPIFMGTSDNAAGRRGEGVSDPGTAREGASTQTSMTSKLRLDESRRRREERQRASASQSSSEGPVSVNPALRSPGPGSSVRPPAPYIPCDFVDCKD